MSRQALFGLLLLGLLVRVAACVVVPLDKTTWADSAQYVNLGVSLAEGNGYRLMEGNCWPGKPTIVRTPGWPVILSVPYRVVPESWRWRVAQVLNVGFDLANLFLIISLARTLGASTKASLISGVLYAINPVTAALCAQAGCEPSGLMFLLLFLRISLEKSLSDVWRYGLGGILLGVACLVRMNWLVIAGFSGLGILWLYRRRMGRTVILSAVFGLGVLLPMMPWLIRNAVEFGRFPVFGAGGGETFYGGNNDRAADPQSPMWGYIVQPGGIPGEPSLMELARKMDEVEVDRYWMAQGVQWLRENPRKIPLLVVGKLRRAFVPIPQNTRSPVVLAASAYRAVLFISALAGITLLVRRREPVSPEAWMLFGSVAAATFLTTILFCGVMRYVIGFEVLLCLPAGWLVARLFGPSEN
jgi:hypothetical protein